MDATADAKGNDRLHQRAADQWIRDCGRDFRLVCSLAGMDAGFLSGAYRAGRVNPVWLRQDPRMAGLAVAEKRRAAARDYDRRRREAARHAF